MSMILEEIFIDLILILSGLALYGVVSFFVEFHFWEKEQQAKRAKQYYNVVFLNQYRRNIKNVR